MTKTYVYKARDRTGHVLTGSIMADSQDAVAAYIRNKGYFVTQIKTQQSESFLLTMIHNLRKVSAKDLAIFCRQFATMADAGLSLISCLTILIDQTYNPQLKAALRVIYKKVQEGESLSKAMSGYANMFSDIMIHMVEAGEVGGVLAEVLSRLAVHFEQEHKLNERITSAMVYPAVVLGIALVSVTFIFLFVLPPLIQLFEDMQAELPLPTQIVLEISGLLTHYGIWLVVILALCAYTVVILARQPKNRLVTDRLLLVLPVFGPLWRMMAIARFSRTLSTLLRGGVPILTAIEVVKKGLGNLSMTNALTKAQMSIRTGMGLATPLGASHMFTPMVVQMVAVGEETGELDKMLEKIADFYDSAVEDMVNRLSSMLEPVLIGILSVIIGFIVISVMLPMFDVLTHCKTI